MGNITLYEQEVYCNLPPESVIQTISNMKKKKTTQPHMHRFGIWCCKLIVVPQLNSFAACSHGLNATRNAYVLDDVQIYAISIFMGYMLGKVYHITLLGVFYFKC